MRKLYLFVSPEGPVLDQENIKKAIILFLINIVDVVLLLLIIIVS